MSEILGPERFMEAALAEAADHQPPGIHGIGLERGVEEALDHRAGRVHGLRIGRAVRNQRVPAVADGTGPDLEGQRTLRAEHERPAAVQHGGEAEQIVVRIERLLGGTSHFAIDSGRGRESEVDNLGFGDVAVLTRTKHQHAAIVGALTRSGIPYRQIAEDEPHDPRSQKVAVMTLHASKGREFEVVFVAGAERGLLPLEVEGLRCDPEEERRLLYVGVTRARSVCVLSHARKRMLFGKTLPGEVSPFLRRLPRSAVLRATASLPEKAPPSPQLDLFGSR